MQVEKGIYLSPEVRYELKKIACTYHITLKSMIPALLLHITDRLNDSYFKRAYYPPGPRKLKNIVIEESVYDRLKIRAYTLDMKLNDFINIGIMAFVRYCDIETFIMSNTYSLRHTGKNRA